MIALEFLVNFLVKLPWVTPARHLKVIQASPFLLQIMSSGHQVLWFSLLCMFQILSILLLPKHEFIPMQQILSHAGNGTRPENEETNKVQPGAVVHCSPGDAGSWDPDMLVMNGRSPAHTGPREWGCSGEAFWPVECPYQVCGLKSSPFLAVLCLIVVLTLCLSTFGKFMGGKKRVLGIKLHCGLSCHPFYFEL